MDYFFKGLVLPEYIGYCETMRFDLSEQQLDIVMSSENIGRYPICGPFEFRFLPVYNTIFLLFRYGNSPWFSAPYSPHLSENFKARCYEEGKGFALTILQISNEDGMIKNILLVTPSTDFCNSLYCAADIIYQTIPFDLQEHRKVIGAVYNAFSTDGELAEQCEENCRCIIA